MKPKEKAKELFDKMYFANDPMRSYPMCYETAKQCALIAVEEIISLNIKYNRRDVENNILNVHLWLDIKQEIENYDNQPN